MDQASVIKAKQIKWIIRDKYKGKTTPKLEKDIARLEQGKPLDYIIGWKPFLDCKIDLSYKPLIPREETEYWVEKVISNIKNNKPQKPITCLDIFAGSGCVGIAILKKLPKVIVDFAEIDNNFLKQIKLNLAANNIDPNRCCLFKSDIFNKIPNKYDYILANPPYIDLSCPKTVQSSVINWEPHLALFGGHKGLDLIDKFLQNAVEYLNPQGKIYMEFGYNQKGSIQQLLHLYKYKNWKFYKDQFGKWRYLVTNTAPLT